MTPDYVFPNDAHVTWSVMIVLYPYITGLVAGAFVVSSLYHLFGQEQLKSVARFSLASAFVFLLFAPLPLLIHLGHPERATNILVTPNFTSAMAGFGLIYLAYLLLVALEVWFVMRHDLIERAGGKGLIAFVCRAILLFDLRESDASRAADKKIIKVLAALGIPMACLLHGYVGFLFGSLKANPWWDTPLMFVIFIFSAIVSGIAVLIFHYQLVSKINRWKVDDDCVAGLGKYLWGFMMVAVTLELLELLSIGYKQTEETAALGRLIKDQLFVSYTVLQFMVFSLVPFFLLASVVVFKMKALWLNRLTWIASAMLLVQVLLMRWNVVIGGQLMSKSMRGFTSYFPDIWNREGLVVAATIFTAPFVLLWVMHRIVPLFPTAAAASAAGGEAMPPPTPATPAAPAM